MPNDVGDILRRFNRAKQDRVPVERDWQEVADLVMPSRRMQVVSADRDRHIYNATARKAARSLAAAVHGLLFNPSIRWMQLVDPRADDEPDEPFAEWLYHATTETVDFLSSTASGFPTAGFEAEQDLVAFGTSVLLARRSSRSLKFQARPLRNIYLRYNDQGELVEFYNQFAESAVELASQFGADNLSEKTRQLISAKKGHERVGVLHAIIRRNREDPGLRSVNKPWASIYIELPHVDDDGVGDSVSADADGGERSHRIAESGFDRMPFIVSRWSAAPGDQYGTSPAIDAMPDIATINQISYDLLMAGEMQHSPPILSPDGALTGPLRVAPRALITYDGSVLHPPTAMNLGINTQLGEAMLSDREGRVEEFFFLDVLKLPDRDRMTATEIIQRRMQGLVLASPILSRLFSEFADPVVMAAVDHLRSTGQIPPAPEHARGKRIGIEYRGPMAVSQRASENESLVRALEESTGLVAVDPGVAGRNMDVDRAFRGVMNNQGVNPRFLRSRQEARRMLQQQRESQQQAQDVAVFREGAAGTRDVAAGLRDVRPQEQAGV